MHFRVHRTGQKITLLCNPHLYHVGRSSLGTLPGYSHTQTAMLYL